MAFVVRKSLKTADDVYDAMLARGFDGSVHSVARLKMGVADIGWSAACVALCTLVLCVDRLVIT
jgi:energy-coupling factor transporter transmembrane protein EcfT